MEDRKASPYQLETAKDNGHPADPAPFPERDAQPDTEPPSLFFPLQTEEGGISFQQWLEVSPDAMIVVNASGHITLINSQVETIFGYTREELSGQPLEILLPERFHSLHTRHRERYASSPRIRPMGAGLELYGRRKDGTEVPVDICLSPLHFHDTFYALAAIRDTTEHRRLQERERLARAEAEERLDLLQLILDELPSGVVLVRGEDARLVLANRAITNLMGVPWPVGQPLWEFLAANSLSFKTSDGRPLPLPALAALRAIQQEETVREVQEVLHRADGSRIPLLVNAVALDGSRSPSIPSREEKEGGKASFQPGALMVYQDVTERIELERRKDEFIGMAGHELRTPVTSIKTYIQLLRRRLSKQGNNSDAELLTRVDLQLGQLTRLIGELLDITQMETGYLPWHDETFALDVLVQEIAQDAQRTSDQHFIRIVGAFPIQIYADRERIGQVLANLFSNAIKYMPQGGTIVLRQETFEHEVQLSVQDEGIGISPEKQAQVFERFYRVRDSAHENFPGLGLGLYLSAEIIKRQGGKIWVQSQSGVGSTFFFTLPREVHHGSGQGGRK